MKIGCKGIQKIDSLRPARKKSKVIARIAPFFPFVDAMFTNIELSAPAEEATFANIGGSVPAEGATFANIGGSAPAEGLCLRTSVFLPSRKGGSLREKRIFVGKLDKRAGLLVHSYPTYYIIGNGKDKRINL
ncbi:hypothetical protein B5F77_05395 [Parabacteroides sp. An277]|nr:hypothetical protein B5F77_05395 [Parabacteroides sp. An277]